MPTTRAMDTETPPDHLVHEAFGPPLPPLEAASAIALGTIALLMVGVMPALLGGLADEGRLSGSGIGLVAALEGLTMALATALAGIVLKPVRLRWLGALAAIALIAADLGTLPASGTGVYIARGLAGIPEGVLLWLTVSMIARTAVPERWSAVFFTALVSGQLALALILWAMGLLIPQWGVDAGYVALIVLTAPGLVFAFTAPDTYAPLPQPEGETGMPPLRGWVALIGTLFFAGAAGAVAVYIQPLAHEAGLSANIARGALWVSLAAQVAAGATATWLAGRVPYIAIFVTATVGYLIAWTVFAFAVPAWAFVAANALFGYMIVFYGPFLVPMTIEADPSRRAALLSAGTQILAGAAAPFVAAFFVDDTHARGSLVVGTVLLSIGLAIIGGLHLHAARARARG